MRFLAVALLCAAAAALPGRGAPEPPPELVLETGAASLTVSLQGGVLTDFHLAGETLNPLAGMGHFLCLDRWGAPSEAEAANGMPFHGEAWHAVWQLRRGPERVAGGVTAEMTAELPLAGLAVHRTVTLSETAPLVRVRETVTNRNRLGRIYNMVQHPTIGAPFLDVRTRVDASAGRGFMQSSPLPNPEQPEVRWPEALQDGRRVDVRRLTDDPDPNVVSYEVLGEIGWTTAHAPGAARLLGYLWLSSEYPWFNAWRHVEGGAPALRGLEFGTTGLHQPYPVLVEKGRIFDLPLYTFLDAGESVTRSYAMFLARTPHDFDGVDAVTHADGRVTVRESGPAGRRLTLPADPLF